MPHDRPDTTHRGPWDAPAETSQGLAQSAAPSAASELELGRGGGGVVHRGRDRHLPRDVAWKSAPRGNPLLERRLLSEANALSALEHPGIVAIYDQCADDGELKLALRIVRGDTLARAIAARPTLAERLPLVRELLKAVEAVAWAHHEGWLHRDLKPDNIMLGSFGEVQVIDWGLARRLDTPPDRELEPLGTVLGTHTTQSPEQARGEECGVASDVWGLGATLYELLTRRTVWPRDPEHALALARTGERAKVLDVAPAVPRPLASIVERALSFHPEARYANARALADDLAAWLDGRRVGAHQYSLGERVGAFARRNRRSLVVLSIALFAVFIAGVFSYLRLENERDRVTSALAQRDREAIRASAGEALRAFADGHRAESEVAAAHALALAEDPTARGVLASWARSPRPQRLLTVATGRCLDADWSATGDRIACGRRDAIELWQDGIPRWTRRLTHRGLAFLDGGSRLLVQAEHGLELIDSLTGRTLGARPDPTYFGRTRPGELAHAALVEDRRVVLVAGRTETLWSPCADDLLQAYAQRSGLQLALCGDGTLNTTSSPLPPQTPAPAHAPAIRRLQTALASSQREFVAAAIIDSTRALIGSTRGVLHELDLRDGHTARSFESPTRRMIHRLDVAPDGRLLVVEFEGAPLTLFDLTTFAPIGTLPGGARPGRWLDAERYTTYGQEAVVWRLRPGSPTDAHAGGKVSGLEVTGDLIAVARDNGASLIATHSGTLDWRHDWGLGVTKAVIPVGDTLFVAVASTPFDGPVRPSIDSGRDTVLMFPVRRLELLPNGALLRTFTHPSADLWWPEQTSQLLANRHVHDLARLGSTVALLETRPRRTTLWSFEDGAAELTSCDTPGATAIALAPGGRGGLTLWLLDPTGLVGLDPDDCSIERRLDAPQAELWKVATSPDGAFIAAGTLSGQVLVWRRDGALVAEVTRHSEAVTALEADPDARFFVSGSWDERLGFIDLATLSEPRESLARGVLDAWGL